MIGKTRRTTEKAVLAILFLLALGPVASAQQKYDHVEYVKSPAPGEKKKSEAVQGSLSLDSTKKTVEFVDKHGAVDFSIPNAAIKGLHYERTSRPRYAEGLLIAWPLLFTKSKKHYLTIQYADAAGAGQFVILQMDKSNYQQILAVAEAQTGVRVDRAEEK